MVQRHAKEDKLAVVREAAAQGESQTREVQQSASLLHPAISSLLKALKPPSSAKQAAQPESPTAGPSSLPTPEHSRSLERGAYELGSLLPWAFAGFWQALTVISAAVRPGNRHCSPAPQLAW